MTELTPQMCADFGREWHKKPLRNSLRSVETFPSFVILHTVCAELSVFHGEGGL